MHAAPERTDERTPAPQTVRAGRGAPALAAAPGVPALRMHRALGNAQVQRMVAPPAGTVQRQQEGTEGEGPGMLGTVAGGLMGEWEEDPTWGMIGVDLGVSLIPIVDQVADARDLSAHLYFMIEKGQHDRPMRWVGLAFSLIGLVPEVGSAVKSASKALIKGAGDAIGQVGELLGQLRRLHPEIGDLAGLGGYLARHWGEFAAYGRRKWDEFLASTISLARAAGLFFRERGAQLAAALEELRARSAEMLSGAFDLVWRQVEAAIERLRRRMGRADRAVGHLALETVPGITRAERELLEGLSEDAWTRVMEYALNGNTIDAVKGKIAEELLVHLPQFDAAMLRAVEAARREGFPPEAVRFVRDIQGAAPRTATRGANAELTDGAFVVVQGDRVRIFTVFESKSFSNYRELASRDSEALGQVGMDFERFDIAPIVVEGRVFPRDRVSVSRVNTEWLGMIPPGRDLSEAQLGAIRAGMPGFRYFHGAVTDPVLKEVAARLVRLLGLEP